MDHPILVGNLLGPDPSLGPYVVEARDPVTLQREANAILASLSAALTLPAAVHNWSVSGGAGNWRLIFDVAFSVGWGLNTSVPVRLAQFEFRAAFHKDQLRAQALAIFNGLNADAFVWGTKFAQSARDGSYLVGVLWSTDSDGSGRPTIEADHLAEEGPYDTETVIIGLAVPQAAQGINYNQREYYLHYALLFNDTTGNSGVLARLSLDGATVTESRITEAATDWVCFSGVIHEIQSAAAAHQYTLRVDVAGVNQVSYRGAVLAAHLVNSESSEA